MYHTVHLAKQLYLVNLYRPQALIPTQVETLIIDEADLILSYGHDEDIRKILSSELMPKVFQSILMSATLSEDVEMLQGLALRDPVRLLLPLVCH